MKRTILAALIVLALAGCEGPDDHDVAGRKSATTTSTTASEAQHEHSRDTLFGGSVPPEPRGLMGDVLAAFAGDALSITPSQDNTAVACGDAQCVQAIELKAVRLSIWTFRTAGDAAKWAAVYPWTHLNGSVMLRFTRDGLQPTSPDAAASYSQSLDDLIEGR